MKSNEVRGLGNHNTALFWEYDTRLARRWNLDPKPTSYESRYGICKNNPIAFSDILGDTTHLYNSIGPYAFTIYDKSSHEIVFLTDEALKGTFQEIKKGGVNINSIAENLRDPKNSGLIAKFSTKLASVTSSI